jgi:hypothetical protein
MHYGVLMRNYETHKLNQLETRKFYINCNVVVQKSNKTEEEQVN